MAVLLLSGAFVTFLQRPYKNFSASRSVEYWEEAPVDEHLISDYTIPGKRRKPISEQEIDL